MHHTTKHLEISVNSEQTQKKREKEKMRSLSLPLLLRTYFVQQVVNLLNLCFGHSEVQIGKRMGVEERKEKTKRIFKFLNF